jgi:cysteine desulfurase/selenocysteine lyase
VLYRELEKKLGIELRIVPNRNGRTHLDDFDAACNARTRLVSVSWVSNRNGYRQDLKGLSEIAHSNGAYLYADAIQAVGVFETNFRDEGVDFLTCGGYKWLYANFGVSPFYVREELLDRIPPDRYGHTHVIAETPDHDYRIQATAAKYEYSAVAYTSVAQLDAALGLISRVGLARIEAQGVGLARELWQGLADLGFDLFTPGDNASAIVTFRHGRDADELKKRFVKENIAVLFRENDEFVRLGVGFYNNRTEIRRFLEVMAAVA